MQNSEIVFSQSDLTRLTVEQLPDGSTAIFDERSKSVHSLNPSATIVWRACASGATLPQIMETLAEHFGAPVDVEVAHHSIAQLQQAQLIESNAPVDAAAMDMGRRSILKNVGSLGALAVPVVLTMTGTEQRAYALQALSGTTTTTTTTRAID